VTGESTNPTEAGEKPMAMSMDDFRMSIDEEFEVVIPDATAEQMDTVGDVYVYLLQETPRNAPIPCPTSRAFYRLRQALTTDLGVDRKRVRPSALLWNLFPRKTRESACAQLAGVLGLPQLTGLVPAARGPTLRGFGIALAVATAGAWLLNLVMVLLAGKPEPVAILFVIWFGVLLLVCEFFGIFWLVRLVGARPVLKVRHLVACLAAQDAERYLQGNQTGWTPATVWTKLAAMLSTRTGIPADSIRPEHHWEDLAGSMQLLAPDKTAPAPVAEAEVRMPSQVRTILLFLWRVFVLLLRIVFYPITLLAWVTRELSGDGPRHRQLTRMFQERPPLPGPAFLELCGIVMEDAPIWLAIRQAVAHCCHLPETAIYPYDDLSSLEWMMVPGPDAHWMDLASDWFEMVLQFQATLGVHIYSDELDRRWGEAKSKGQLETLNELAAMLTKETRGLYGACRFPRSQTLFRN
jgi:hypothetical protein